MATSLRNSAKGSNRAEWDDPIKADIMAIPMVNTQIRLFPHIVQVVTHRIEFVSATKGLTGFPKLCLNWDPVKNCEVDRKCPGCEMGLKKTSYSYGYCFQRKQASKGNLVIQPIRMTGPLVSKILGLSEMVYSDIEDADERPDATDPEKGFDFFVKMTKNNNKTEYDANPIAGGNAGKSPISKKEQEAFEEYLEAGKDVEKLAKSGSREEFLDTLHKRGVLGGDKKKKPAASTKSQKDYDDADEVPEDEPKAKGPPKVASSNSRRQTALDDDDDTGVARSRSGAKADDDDIPEDAGDPEDADE